MAATQVKSRKVAFLFGEDGTTSPAVLGGKGAGLSELVQLAVPVPPGFTVTTAVARAFAQHGRLPNRLQHQLNWEIAALEQQTGKTFGSSENPLLVSVRSGAPVSMPGMLDTVLNLGLNPSIVRGLSKIAGQRFAYDCYRRFLSMFGEVVLGVDRHMFEAIFNGVKAQCNVNTDQELESDALQEVCSGFRSLIEKETGKPVADNPREQLELAIVAVLKSWNNPRAKAYRQAKGIANDLGTAVNVQSMVYGNLNDNSCTGVVFSHNITTGEPGLWGEFLVNAQGEDVVAGIRAPMPIAGLKVWNPGLYAQLDGIVAMLAGKRQEVVDIEFTVESSKLWTLQVRGAKLTAEATATFAVHQVWAGNLTKEQALASISVEQLGQLRNRGFDPEALRLACENSLLAKGLPASPGVAVGRVVFSSEDAVEAAARGEKVILVRPDTSPDDLPGMLAAEAIVTMTGGVTCHAAVVACSLGKPAIVGCSQNLLSHFDYSLRLNFPVDYMEGDSTQATQLKAGKNPCDMGVLEHAKGWTISVDGHSGVVVEGKVKLGELACKKEVNIFLRWVAQAEAKHWRKPRLAFEMFEQQKPATLLLGDFYLIQHMTRVASQSSLATEALVLRSKVHTDVAERLAMYLVTAVSGELRHGKSLWVTGELKELQEQFAVRLNAGNDSRISVQKPVITQLKQQDSKAHLRFLELSIKFFNNGKWSGGIGGSKWGQIAQAAYDFLSGKLSHSVFADHAFDLEHNNGTVFGKHQMLQCNSMDRALVEGMLDAKKRATGPGDLYYKLVTDWSASFSSEIQALYQKGLKLGLWSTAEAL